MEERTPFGAIMACHEALSLEDSDVIKRMRDGENTDLQGMLQEMPNEKNLATLYPILLARGKEWQLKEVFLEFAATEDKKRIVKMAFEILTEKEGQIDELHGKMESGDLHGTDAITTFCVGSDGIRDLIRSLDLSQEMAAALEQRSALRDLARKLADVITLRDQWTTVKEIIAEKSDSSIQEKVDDIFGELDSAHSRLKQYLTKLREEDSSSEAVKRPEVVARVFALITPLGAEDMQGLAADIFGEGSWQKLTKGKSQMGSAHALVKRVMDTYKMDEALAAAKKRLGSKQTKVLEDILNIADESPINPPPLPPQMA
jgi:hypothetical protein